MSFPDTQLKAYNDVKPKLPEKRQIVFEAINDQRREGATTFELCKLLGWPVNQISGRVTELHESTHVVDSGKRRLNPATGKTGVVWMTRAHFEDLQRGRKTLFHRNGQGELF